MISGSLLLFLGLAGALALTLGYALHWGALDIDRPALLDPERKTREMLEDPTLTDEEREYMRELAVLELPRRHICC